MAIVRTCRYFGIAINLASEAYNKKNRIANIMNTVLPNVPYVRVKIVPKYNCAFLSSFVHFNSICLLARKND